MDSTNTQAAWQSRTVQLAAVAILANLIEAVTGARIDVTLQGYVVDLLPLILAGITTGALYFRTTARKVIDRWF